MVRITCLGFLLVALQALAQPPEADLRNSKIPDTDTHFAAREYQSLEEWKARKDDLREQILFAAGLDPMPERGDLGAQVFDRLDREGYTIEKVLLRTLPGFYLGGNLYRPKGNGPFPAVLKPHGHWEYGRLEHQPLNSTQTLAVNLARLGFVVFAYDMVGYNDTYQVPHRFSGRREQLWAFGPLGLQLWNSIRALDFVEDLPDVDKTRIAVTGASGGGTQAFLLAAVDSRIASSAPVNMVSAIMQGGCVCENAPGLRVDTFNVETAGIMAPRPQLLVAATGDWTKNVPREEFPAVRRFYSLYGKPENVEAVQFDAPHNYHQDSRVAVYRFLAKRLLGRADAAAIEEQRIGVEQPRDLLALYGRPLPADAVDYDGLFQWWRDNAKRQAAAITKPDAARRLLRVAIKPSRDFAVKSEATGSGDKIVLYRPGAGDRVPGIWSRRSASAAALVLHPKGAGAACASAEAKEQSSKDRSVLCLDVFQTGSAVAPRDRSHQHFLTFNLSDDANRVQDILTGLAFLESFGVRDIELIGLDGAAVWATFAAALSPVKVRLHTDLGGFTGDDKSLLDGFFVPGIQRAGGLDAAVRLTTTMR